MKVSAKLDRKKGLKTTAANERFCVIAAVSPQKRQCEFESLYPAGSSVEAATTQSRHHVSRHPCVQRLDIVVRLQGNSNLKYNFF